MEPVTILIPTCDRPAALAVTLASLAAQEYQSFQVVISDQGEREFAADDSLVQAACRVLTLHGSSVEIVRNVPKRGLAQQRQFLLDRASGRYCLYLDDDLILEPFVLGNLCKTIEQEQCGFVGNAVIGLSYMTDHRPHEQAIELWHERIKPERVVPGSGEWYRYRLHNAANLLHVAEQLQATPEKLYRYKVAWVGGCILYDVAKLRRCGGFTFWHNLPIEHCGEDVLAQLRVMRTYGGCGILPSGVYHQELPTTVPNRRVNAPEYLLAT